MANSFFLPQKVLFSIILFLFSCSAPPEPTENSTTSAPSKKEAPAPPASKLIEDPIASYDFDTTEWLELTMLDSSFLLDLRYATKNNFVKEKMYTCGRCFLRPEAARALVDVQRQLKKQGLRIKLFDCYRPRPIQQKLWDKVPNASYVTPPHKGSMHNRGKAVDLTLADANGGDLDLGTDYDFFGPKAHHSHTDLPEEVLANRRLLKDIMKVNGFGSIRTEWWHYNFRGPSYPLDDWLWNCPDENSDQ